MIASFHLTQVLHDHCRSALSITLLRPFPVSRVRKLWIFWPWQAAPTLPEIGVLPGDAPHLREPFRFSV